MWILRLKIFWLLKRLHLHTHVRRTYARLGDTPQCLKVDGILKGHYHSGRGYRSATVRLPAFSGIALRTAASYRL